MKLWTTTIGDGPKRAALVHGLSGDSDLWFELAPWIADHGYTVTLLDQRGHGRSARASSYLTEDLGDDLVETLPAGMDLVVGESLGGRALLAAVDRLLPQRAIYLEPGWEVPADLPLTLPLQDDGSLVDEETLAALYPAFQPHHVTATRISISRCDRAWFEGDNPSLPDMTPSAEPVVPSLVVLADPPLAVTPDLVTKLAAGGYVVRTVPGGQHNLYIADLEGTKRAMADWL
ncbi:alpha/beta fold hydrolase [Microbacterium sp. RD1]|uniref:alpha/beta fold hydrolase n=1 Tax=Microbacterium sp. RD1 TaxID=3457313 RepID=UPI003FA58238